MTVLVLIDLNVHDPKAMSYYESQVVPLIAQYGGKILIKDLEPDLYEGSWAPGWMVILEFPTRAAVRAFYDAPEYQPIRAIRTAAATSNGLIVVGS